LEKVGEQNTPLSDELYIMCADDFAVSQKDVVGGTAPAQDSKRMLTTLPDGNGRLRLSADSIQRDWVHG
jgi:hypothetical protein